MHHNDKVAVVLQLYPRYRNHQVHPNDKVTVVLHCISKVFTSSNCPLFRADDCSEQLGHSDQLGESCIHFDIRLRSAESELNLEVY